MTVTLLLDLDDTLLINPMDAFLPAYLKGLGARLAPYVAPDRMVKTLLAATGEMTRNRRPDQTLEAVFDAAFYPALGLEKSQVHPTIAAFYAEGFPQLKKLTSPNPQAAALVEEARRRGWQIGIATNPIFPRTAIEQRIRWAGFSPQDFDFTPSYETFHFAKPSPAYFAEFLAQMGGVDGAVVMVGDDWENDIVAAKQAGLAAYWLNPEGDGDLSGVLAWVDALPEKEAMGFSTPTAVLAALRAAPAALQTFGVFSPQEAWCQPPALNEWCFTEILCHLRDAEIEVNLPRLKAVLTEDNPFLPGEDMDTWKDTRHYDRQDGASALQAFMAARQELLALLEPLPSALQGEWLRAARHAIFGPTQLFEMITFVAEHDRLHVRQAKTALSWVLKG